MEKLQIASKYLLAAAIIYFSTVFLLFVHEAAETRKAIPHLIDKLASIENNDNILEVLRLAAQITGNTAKISGEVSKIRKDLPTLYAEIDKTRSLIPDILEELRAIRGDLPTLYTEIDKTRALVPGVLDEVKAVREESPQLLAETEALLDKAQKISDNAGKGAVHGTVKGIITAPLNVLESGFSTMKNAVTGKKKEEKKP